MVSCVENWLGGAGWWLFAEESAMHDSVAYRQRQRERFPHHACELPYTPDRVFPTLPPYAPLRSRLKAWVQRRVVAWRRHPYIPHMRPSNFALEKEQAQHIQSSSWKIIHPMSRLSLILALIVSVANIILLLILPYDRAFLQTRRFLWGFNYWTRYQYFTIPYVFWLDKNIPQVVDHFESLSIIQVHVQRVIDLCNGLFYLYILLSFITGYYLMQHNVVIMEHSSIVKRYLRTWFFFDVISCIPIEEAAQVVTYFNQEPLVNHLHPQMRITLYVYSVLYALRLLRLHQVYSAIKVWGKVCSLSTIITYFILYLITYLLFVMWSVYLMVRAPFLVEGPWLFTDDNLSWVADPFHRYLRLNRTHALARQFFVAVHRVFHAAGCFSPYLLRGRPAHEDVVVMGAVMWAASFFSVVLFCLIMRFTETAHFTFVKMKRVYSQLVTYIRARRVPLLLRRNIVFFYKNKFAHNFYNEKEVLLSFTINMRHAINISICRRVVVNSALFQGFPKALLNKIAANLIEETYLTHELVYSSDSEASYLYFLSIGTAAVYLPTGEEMGHLVDGDFFGIMGLVLPELHQRHVESVVTLETCQVFKLPRSAFWKLVRPMPALHTRLHTIARFRKEDLFAKAVYPIDEDAPPFLQQPSDTESESEYSMSSTSSLDEDLVREMKEMEEEMDAL